MNTAIFDIVIADFVIKSVIKVFLTAVLFEITTKLYNYTDFSLSSKIFKEN